MSGSRNLQIYRGCDFSKGSCVKHCFGGCELIPNGVVWNMFHFNFLPLPQEPLFCKLNKRIDKMEEASSHVIREALNVVEDCISRMSEELRVKFSDRMEEITQLTSLTSKKRVLEQIRNLSSRLSRGYPRETENFIALDIMELFIQDNLDILRELPIVMLQRSIRKFFGDEYPGWELEIGKKKKGIQLGQIVFLRCEDHNMKFYVKTHRGGSLGLEKSTRTIEHPVHASEILVYKFLELIRIGPKVHFFFDSPKEFYIATLDAGYDEETNQQGEFLTYIQARNSEIGCFFREIESVLTEDDWDEERLSLGAKNLIGQLSLLDLVTRICNLRDVATNYDNFGFAFYNKKLVIIDFVVELILTPEDNFKSFLKGYDNHIYRDSRDPVIRYVFCTRGSARRKESAKEALIYLGKDTLVKAVDDAHRFTLDILSKLQQEPGDLPLIAKHFKKVIREYSKRLNE